MKLNEQAPPREDDERPASEGRRRLLRAIGAAGAMIGAAATVPEKWARPVVEFGVVPANAQGSNTLTIAGLQVQPYATTPAHRGATISPNFLARFSYIDLLMSIYDCATLKMWILETSEIIFNHQPIGMIPGLVRNGGPSSGQISVPFYTATINGTLQAQLGQASRLSNILTTPLTNGTIR